MLLQMIQVNKLDSTLLARWHWTQRHVCRQIVQGGEDAMTPRTLEAKAIAGCLMTLQSITSTERLVAMVAAKISIVVLHSDMSCQIVFSGKCSTAHVTFQTWCQIWSFTHCNVALIHLVTTAAGARLMISWLQLAFILLRNHNAPIKDLINQSTKRGVVNRKAVI